MDTLNIGLLGVHSDNYFAVEYTVYEKCAEALESYGILEGFKVHRAPLVRSAAEAMVALGPLKAQPLDYLLVLNAGFSMGDVTKALRDISCPMGIWAVPEPTRDGDIKLHSLVSMNLYTSIMRLCRDGSAPAAKWFYGEADSELFKNRFSVTLGALRGIKALVNAKIGVIGDTADGFYNLETDGKNFERFSVQSHSITVEALAERAKTYTSAQIEASKAIIVESAGKCEVSGDALEKGALAYLALSEFCRENELSALSAACWPDFQEYFGIVPCVPFTLLGDLERIPVACEGDYGAALNMLLASAISRKMPAIMDVAAMSPENGSLQLWHCGIGSGDLASEKEKIAIVNHPMMNRKNPQGKKYGLSYDYVFRPQPVVVSRLSGNGGSLMCFSGAVSQSEGGYQGTRGFVEDFSFDGRDVTLLDVVDSMWQHGVEHHLVLSAGTWEEAFLEFATLSRTPVLEIDRYHNYINLR